MTDFWLKAERLRARMIRIKGRDWWLRHLASASEPPSVSEEHQSP